MTGVGAAAPAAPSTRLSTVSEPGFASRPTGAGAKLSVH